MKTLEVLDKLLKGRRLKSASQRLYTMSLTSLSNHSEDWPIDSSTINEWITSISGYSDTSVRIFFDLVNSAGAYIEKVGGKNEYGQPKIPNPCRDAERPKVSEKARRYFTENEILAILDACKHDYDRELILTLMDSTARIGELAGLRGIDVADNCIMASGKTGRHRYRLDARICKALKELAGSDDGFVFKRMDGGQIDGHTLGLRVKRIILRAGVKGEKLGPHTIRHSGASFVARETKSALAVKALLKHSKIETSMKYIHDVEDEIQQEISPLQLMVDKATNGEADIYGDKEKPRQIGLGEGDGMTTAVVLSEPELVEGVIDYSGDIFPKVPEGVEVRPLLKEVDLNMLRRIFVDFDRQGGNHQDMLMSREFMKRILRKSKVRK